VLPVAVVSLGLVLLPLWTVQSVEIRGSEVVPRAVEESLHGLVGHLVPVLDLGWVHGVVAAWPEAAEVRVQLDLPGTVVVEIFPQSCRGSVKVGAGWHAVTANGQLAGAISGPRPPELVGFHRPADRRLAFAVARRLVDGCGGEVGSVRQVTPSDYVVELQFAGNQRVTTVHVTPEGTEAEGVWCGLVRVDGAQFEWADLRWAHRLVLREAA
jgi:hypothetical protein